jgi:hypothetical protein
MQGKRGILHLSDGVVEASLKSHIAYNPKNLFPIHRTGQAGKGRFIINSRYGGYQRYTQPLGLLVLVGVNLLLDLFGARPARCYFTG